MSKFNIISFISGFATGVIAAIGTAMVISSKLDDAMEEVVENAETCNDSNNETVDSCDTNNDNVDSDETTVTE